jgi:pimeloyl-ACP methyl ester carboxylesterase
MTALAATTITTAKGASVRVREGGSGADVVFVHDVTGLLDRIPFLEQLAEDHHVVAPELPGYGESTGEELLEDMLDFALHGWDVCSAFGLSRPTLIGLGMGGMIAAEMAALAPGDLSRLVLVAPLGLWLDEAPIPDMFSMLPYEFPRALFADARAGTEMLLAGGEDFTDLEALKDFYVGNTRRLGTAGKILFPIPNRRLAKRLYRVITPTLLVWGERDGFVPPVYAGRWADLLPRVDTVTIPAAGHMVPYEQPDAFLSLVVPFLAQPSAVAAGS